MSIRAFKYYSPLILYIGAWLSFTSHGWLCYSTIIYGFGVIPLAELFLRPDEKNFNAAEEEIAKADRLYDLILYFIVLLQLPTLFFFLYSMQDIALTLADKIGRIGTMGLICGTLGINVGHELGHRINPVEQWLAKTSLMTSLYVHYFVEHNKGHHKNVATPGDPSSARYGELLYTFWFRTIVYTYISAWHIANNEMKKKGRPIWSLHNEMIQAHLMEFLLLTLIFILFGPTITCYFLVAALLGILLLETVNYIEHYGLSRKQVAEGKYERAMPHHSWNSNHLIGRLMLFELSRHSDHHYLASRKYQVLRHHEDAPQLPTGYPGMMLLSLIPPAWFWVMNKRIKSLVPRSENKLRGPAQSA